MRLTARVLILLLAFAAVPRAAGKRPITETDLYRFTWIADPQISPDGGTVAFVQVTGNEKDNKYDHPRFTAPPAGPAAPERIARATRAPPPRAAPCST